MPTARILIIGGDGAFRTALADNLPHHRCTHADHLAEARTLTAKQRFDLLLLDPALPDGDGLDFAQRLLRTAPATKLVVFTESGSFRTALRAIRCGAIDYIRVPAELGEVRDRVETALTKTLTEKDRESRIRRLHSLCTELNSAREEISDQVDVLCNDLVVAYHDLHQQLQDVAMASEFRTLLRQELDLEEVLRTTLEYLLTKTGPTNAAVFLPDPNRQYSLGAYVNYDCPRESIDAVLDHLCDAICPQMADETELVAFDDAEEFADWIGMEDRLLAESQVIAYSCIDEQECMAVVVLFRDKNTPFEPALAGTLDILRAIFAEQLSQVIRIHHRSGPQWPAEPSYEDELDDLDDDHGFGFGGGLAA
ncbi:MAG: response regulator [Phycisphaerae bacterium]|nr:response regulator [Phycisphaerae bacterium]